MTARPLNVVVAGGGYAGVVCAARLSARAGDDVSVTLVSDASRFVQRIRLHQAISRQEPASAALESLLKGIKVVTGTVDAIHADERRISSGGTSIRYDRLVLALGSRTASPGIAGAEDHVHPLNPGNVGALRARLDVLAGREAAIVVVGGGLTGIETAFELKEAYPALGVSLVTAGPLLSGWSPQAHEHLERRFREAGIQVFEGTRVHRVTASAVDTNLLSIPCDLCVWTAGFAFPGLPRDAGVAVSEEGKVLTDPYLRSVSHPEIYAAGDIAWPLAPPGHPLPMGCKSAMPMGVQVAENIAREAHGIALERFDYAIPFHCVSLGRKDGLIQFPDKQGRLLGRAVTGRWGAWIKETVCKSTYWSVFLEARGLPVVRWLKTGHAPG